MGRRVAVMLSVVVVALTGVLVLETDGTSSGASGSSFGALAPARVFETRVGATTVDGEQQGVGRRTADQVTQIQIAGRANVPTDAVAAVVNATAISPDFDGFVTLFPCGQQQPGSSTLNYPAGGVVANGAVIALGTGGTVCVYTQHPMDFVLDVTGYFPAGGGTSPTTPTTTAPPAPWTGCQGVTQIPTGDCTALTALYNSTNGSNWVKRTGWLDNNAPCSWHGVTCSSGRVTQLVLFENNLSGPIPTQIGNLTALTDLRLGRSQLTGSIPAQIGNLTNLRVLYLPGNQLTGSIPPQIGNLTKLVNLHLGLNKLSGSIPPQIGDGLVNLEYLNLFENKLSGSIPANLSKRTNLHTLVLGDNDLSGTIPQVLGGLTKLVLLDLGDNELTGSIPAEVGNLTNLVDLYLNGNQLAGAIPSEITDLTKLKVLRLRDNGCFTADPATEGFVSNLDPNWENGC